MFVQQSTIASLCGPWRTQVVWCCHLLALIIPQETDCCIFELMVAVPVSIGILDPCLGVI